jgi:hypothetical protein
MTILDDLHHHLGDEITRATDVLSVFIEHAATRTADEVGFSYVLVANAPNTFPSLTEAYARSVATGEPLPISSENSDDVIYTPASVNGALRFWHDVNHVRRPAQLRPGRRVGAVAVAYGRTGAGRMPAGLPSLAAAARRSDWAGLRPGVRQALPVRSAALRIRLRDGRLRSRPAGRAAQRGVKGV